MLEIGWCFGKKGKVEWVQGTSLVIQWGRLYAPNVGDLGSIPGQGSRSHMIQLRPSTAKINNLKKKDSRL